MIMHRGSYRLLRAAIVAAVVCCLTPQVQAGILGRCCKDDCCRKCCEPCPTVTKTLTVCHPCTGCELKIKVCVPACCTGEPEVCCRNTLIGGGAVTYHWCCGTQAVVRFTRCGDYHVRVR